MKETSKKKTFLITNKKSLKLPETEKSALSMNFRLVGTDSEFRIVSFEISKEKG